MKKVLSKQEEKLALGIFAVVIAVCIAQFAIMANILKLVSRGNKALKIYIDKNKYFEKFSSDDFEEEYNDEDIPF